MDKINLELITGQPLPKEKELQIQFTMQEIEKMAYKKKYFR